MPIQTENFRIKNQTRGRATVLCTFGINMGSLTIKGFELIRTQDGKSFVSAPHNRYQHKETQEWRRFNYLAYNGERGAQLQQQIFDLAMEEYTRRSSGGMQEQQYQPPHQQQQTTYPNPQQPPQTPYPQQGGGTTSGEPSVTPPTTTDGGIDDGLPF